MAKNEKKYTPKKLPKTISENNATWEKWGKYAFEKNLNRSQLIRLSVEKFMKENP